MVPRQRRDPIRGGPGATHGDGQQAMAVKDPRHNKLAPIAADYVVAVIADKPAALHVGTACARR